MFLYVDSVSYITPKVKCVYNKVAVNAIVHVFKQQKTSGTNRNLDTNKTVNADSPLEFGYFYVSTIIVLSEF